MSDEFTSGRNYNNGMSASSVGDEAQVTNNVSSSNLSSSLSSPYTPDSLLDIAARIVAENEPFQRVEEKYDRIPEPVQQKIIFYSFPRDERDIQMYSSLSRASSSFNATDSQSLSFSKGLKLLESNCVENVLQVGFHLSGEVWTFQPDVNKSRSSSSSNSSTVAAVQNNHHHQQQQQHASVPAILQPYPPHNNNNNNNLNILHQNQNGNAAAAVYERGGINTDPNSVQFAGEENKKFKVSVSFDRCKITSVKCSCDTKDIFWCHHVVALALYRIRNATSVKLRVPISETLLQMNRQQLQKFVQYLIAEHYTEVLPTAQKLADEILRQKTEINSICGAPDPTAGASKDDENSWHLDEAQVCEVVRSYLGQGSYYNSNKQLNCLFGKVREMLRAQDSNGARMLTLITEQFLHDPRLVLWKSHGTPMTEKCRQLWDQLGSLWVCIVLNPRCTQVERNHWKELLESWSKIDVCPQEDPDFRPPGRESHRLRSQREREYERNRFFRENNQRNALYHQYQQQQQQQAQNNNYNQRYYDNPPNNENENRGYLNAANNNYDESSSSSSDSDSESESDEEMEENNEARNLDDGENQNGLMDVPVENLFDPVPKDDNDRLIERINNFIEEEENAVMNDLSLDRDNARDDAQESANDEDCFKFDLPALRDNDDSSRESMDEDQIREEHEILESINNLDRNKEDDKGLEDFDDEFLPDQKAILKMDNLNYIDEHVVEHVVDEEHLDHSKENEEEAMNLPEAVQVNLPENEVVNDEAVQNQAQDDEQKKIKKSRPSDAADNKPNKKLKLNNGSSVAKITTKVPRTIFHKALDAVNMTWDNKHLKLILASDTYSLASENSVQIAGSSKMVNANNTSSKSNFNSLGQPLWYESMSMCAARIDSLRSHGHIDAALRLSVSVVRTMKQVQQDAQQLWQKYRKQTPPITTIVTASAIVQKPQLSGPSTSAISSSSSTSDCNNSKCKDCQLNKLFEFTIHKSSTYASSFSSGNKNQPMPNSENPNVNDCHKCTVESNDIPEMIQQQSQEQSESAKIVTHQQQQPQASTSKTNCYPPPYQNTAQPPKHCNSSNSSNNNACSSSSAPSTSSSSSSSSSSIPNSNKSYSHEMPPPPPRKLMTTQCMCHYNPPNNQNHHLHNHHHQGQNYYMSKNSAPVPNNSNCQPICHYANSSSGSRHNIPHHMPMPAPSMPSQQASSSSHHSHHNHHHQPRMNMPGPSNQQPQQQLFQPGPAPHPHHGTNSNNSNKFYECHKNMQPAQCSSNNGPMAGACPMHQKRPCIKNMCCSIVPPPEKHHYYPRQHCNAPVPSKYDYMSKYPPPPLPGSSFCNGCMRSNCLLKTQNPQMMAPPTMHQPPPPSIPLIPQIPPPMQPTVTLCKNCKASESKPQQQPMKIQVPPIPQQLTVSAENKAAEQAKYNIVNYGASTSKGPASSSSSSSNAASSSSSTSSIVTPFNKKNPSCVSKCLDCTVGCEIEFPLDAVACIFDCLTEACITTTDVVRLNGVEDSNIIASKYKHIQVPGSKDSNETFLTLAFEAAILALGKQRIMPQGLYSQHLICKQQDQLIARLRNVDLDQLLVEVIKNLSTQMMDGGPTSGFGESIHPESVPMHTLARFLFASLLNQHPDLAFKIGLRAMRFPIFENVSSNSADGPTSPSSPYARWWTLGHLESQQCSLSSTMLSASKGDKVRLSAVLENARHNIHSSTHLFKLAQDAFRFATPENGPRSHTLLEVAFELGLQVMRMTRTCLNWRRREMVRWLVTCATQLGLEATLSIMQNWYELFTPTEATGPVATTIMSHSTIMRLNLNIKQQEELSSCARTLALQCATKDPPNCALNALTLCENDPMAFETAYHIVIDAANHIMTSSQLFTIARYMEHRGFPVRAYNLAILAMKNVHLAYNQDTHPAINDIHWACALSHTLGKAELSKMIPLVVKNVQCATVLSDILRRCSVPNPGMSHFNGHHRGNNMRSCNKLSYDREPLNQLLEAAISAYVNTTHSRLSHISPRHYGDFIDFLSKARDTFVLARDGPAHFSRLIENITIAYKGKKKLVRQVRQRFY
ncbi:hypothetical protein PVAND_004703 [Polypedilum vanderplanki]|uniref:SWIM-type domain-containing protein n=1 Tax=Polypedilum vanderplanki TaxID=319348 RepID=A0A9J6BXR2_POLVA|nr:hypothetical protein PVAND_004703 [Polypedilum vanderplanki]